MLFGVRYIADVAILLAALGFQGLIATRLVREEWRNTRLFNILQWVNAVVLLAGAAANIAVILNHSLHAQTVWFRGLTLAWGLALWGAALAARFFPEIDQYRPERRKFLSTVSRVAVAAPLVITAAGAYGRHQFRLTEVDVKIPNLPKDLEGLRIVQISDVHLSPFLQVREFARVVDMANETKANIAVVTGDLITAGGDPLDDALREVARLKSDAGIFGCHGNHEIYARATGYATVQGKKLGIEFLRNQAQSLRFGNANLNLAGVDYQRMRLPYLPDADKLVQPDQVNVLLSHNPDVFTVSKDLGFDLTLSGHTHGGQINVEILHENLNVARFVTPYTSGLYTEKGQSVFVSTGIGTVGVPVRFGAPPEVALIRLCAA